MNELIMLTEEEKEAYDSNMDRLFDQCDTEEDNPFLGFVIGMLLSAGVFALAFSIGYVFLRK